MIRRSEHLLDSILTKDFLIEEYINKRKSSCKIARELDCSTTSIMCRLTRYNIKHRTISEALTGCKQTDERKAKYAKNRKGRLHLYNEELSREIHIWPQEVEQYIKIGWKLGHLPNHIKKQSLALKGRSYVDLYGEEKAREILGRKLLSISKSVCKSPNKFEINALAYVNTIYDNRVKYTGNGTLVINGRSADAILEGTKTIFLFHGVYYHLGIDELEITEENKRAVEKVDSLPFISAGYSVIFIWEDELNEEIRNRFTDNKNLCKIYK